MYSCHLFFISSAFVRSLLFLSFLGSIFVWNVTLVLEEICSLSHSIVFLYFFTLVTYKGFLISPCYFLELCVQLGISFPFSFSFCSPLFSAICKASSDNHFAFLHFFFLGMVLVILKKEMAAHSSILAWRILWMEEPSRLQSMGSQRGRHDWATITHLVITSCTVLQTSIHSLQALCLPDLIPWIYSSPPLYNHKRFDRSHMNGLVVFPTFFNLSLNLQLEANVLSHSQLQSVCWLYRASLSLDAKNIINMMSREYSYSIIYPIISYVGQTDPDSLPWPMSHR